MAVADRFRRRGVVRARLLTADRSWTTSAGSVLRGRVGDWWVESPDGSARSVTAAEFPQLYEAVGGDRFRRRGEVNAVQVTEASVVATLEGDAAAGPGMWLVTDDRGNSWPVPDDEFRSGYEPA